MLVLSRKVTEEIVIGNTIRVVVLKVGSGRVKLGFTAPSDVAIYREEICPGDFQMATTSSGRDREHASAG